MFNPNEVERTHLMWDLDDSWFDCVKAADYDALFELYKASELELSKIGITHGVGPYTSAVPDNFYGRGLLAIIRDESPENGHEKTSESTEQKPHGMRITKCK